MITEHPQPGGAGIACLPGELLLSIARYLWYGPGTLAGPWREKPLGISKCNRFMQLTTREPAILGVCRRWRHAVLSDFGRFVIANCHLESRSASIPFLSPDYTREVWLRFDGALLFGNWAIEWAREALGRGGEAMAIEKLIMVIVEAPNTATTAVEDMRAKALVGICQQALAPRKIGLFSQPCGAEIPGVQSKGIGDKFACLYVHFHQMDAPPILSSIDTSRISHESMLWLIAGNAATLEYLRIASVLPSHLQQLVSDTSGDLVFSRLREVQMTLDLEDSSLKPYRITTTHFPRLEVLFVDMPADGISPQYETGLSIFEHAFLTDLFLSKRSQLRSLRFPVSWDTIDILTSELLPEACDLTLYQISMEGEHVPDSEESSQLLWNMLSLSHARQVTLNTASSSTELPLQLVCTRLRSLVISGYHLSAEQIHHLLCEILSLRILHCQLGEGSPAGLATADLAVNQAHIARTEYCWKASTSTRPHDDDRLGLTTPRAMRTLNIRIPPGTSDASIQRFFSVIAALPCIRTIYLPGQLNRPLYRHLQQASKACRHCWSETMLDSIRIRTHTTPSFR
ncbi:hypothetical protein IWW55_000701 [Coemansia sp. RSA 2706]|nr:hypothetical protein IWW54_004736 [Coemansia sp. RSA 2705]KAJ2307961.1 hypothetical protein IWW55_000701 [Coemansia sp. RSA 2706]KAJ2318413.1 hypothetical protein IWW52_002576 [Coemansia sp. RSA 2704]KAJ2735518.1 hypothetical protein H4R23_002183 [Coemansia sp. Cherry 401B]